MQYLFCLFMISAHSCDFSSWEGGKKPSVFVGQMVKWPFRVIPQALKAARTLLPANCRIVGVEGKADPWEEHHSSWAWKVGVWGGVIFCLSFFFSISIFWWGERSVLVI